MGSVSFLTSQPVSARGRLGNMVLELNVVLTPSYACWQSSRPHLLTIGVGYAKDN